MVDTPSGATIKSAVAVAPVVTRPRFTLYKRRVTGPAPSPASNAFPARVLPNACADLPNAVPAVPRACAPRAAFEAVFIQPITGIAVVANKPRSSAISPTCVSGFTPRRSRSCEVNASRSRKVSSSARASYKPKPNVAIPSGTPIKVPDTSPLNASPKILTSSVVALTGSYSLELGVYIVGFSSSSCNSIMED